MKEIQLMDHQRYTKNVILSQRYCGLFLDCSAGKTLTTLCALYDENPHWHVLVIAPRAVAMSTWTDEIKKWDFPFRVKSLMVNDNGKKLSRKKRLERYAEIPTDPPTIYFISIDLIQDLIDNLPHKKKKPIWYFPTVILDESQSFKSPSSLRFKALKAIRSQIWQLIELTGTPAPNGLEDLWSQIYLLDGGLRLGRTLTEYRNTFFRPTMIVNNQPVGYVPLPGAEDEIFRRISDIVVSVRNPNIQLPDVTYTDAYVHFTDTEKKLYKQFVQSYVLNVDGVEITAANAAVLQGKLSQLASGAIYTDENHTFKILHKHKLEYCDYIISNTDSPVIIAYRFYSDKQMLLDYFPQAVAFDGTPAMIHDWNAGKIPLLLFQPASTCHGLNLQEGGHTLIWYSLPWSLEQYLQTNKRLHRKGQKSPVAIYHILTENTVDSHILQTLNKKDATERRLLDSVAVNTTDAVTIVIDTLHELNL